MGLMKEFRDFAMRGNVVDMAVGIIIGAAFGEIVSSLVKDVMMPPLGWAMSGVDFSQMSLKLNVPNPTDLEKSTFVEIKYGAFINAIIKFTIVAFALFMIIKAMNTLKKKEEVAPAKPPEPTPQEKLLGEIRDILKTRA